MEEDQKISYKVVPSMNIDNSQIALMIEDQKLH